MQLWILTPIAPLLAAVAILIWRDKALHAVWLCCLPALLAAALAPPAAELQPLWPGASWGGDSFMLRGLLMFTAALWLAAGLFAMHSLRDDTRRHHFWVFWLLSLSGNLLLIIAGDALSFYVGFSAMSLAAYGLIIHHRTVKARRAGRLYLQIAVTGELLLFTGLIMASHQTGGSLILSEWRNAEMGHTTLLLLFTGLGLKAGFWPLHVWLPQAHPVAPAPASAVLSGAMIKAGILGLWQLMPTESPILEQWSTLLLYLGLFSAFYGVALGLTRRDAKEVLAYSSVSQMGYLLLITAMHWQQPMAPGAPALAVLLTLYAVHHGFAKGALFLSAELLKSGRPSQPRARLALQAMTALPALALAGLPLSSGAAVKTLLKDSATAMQMEQLNLLLQFGAAASLLVLLRALALLTALMGKAPAGLPPAMRLYSWLPLCLACIALPWAWLAMREALLASLPWYKLAELLLPIAGALLLATVARQRQWRVPEVLARQQTPFLRLSLLLKYHLQRPPVPAPEPTNIPRQRWRNRERRWNRFWHGNTVGTSSWLLLLLFLAAILLVYLI